HLTAVAGKVRVDSLVEFGKPGYQTALALTAVAAERALILVKDQLLVDSNPADNGGKTHKIVQTLNEVTNKMSHTGTAFSSGNWETDTWHTWTVSRLYPMNASKRFSSSQKTI
ncbi:uncharacterized protein BJ212DRAFT_1307214, partial [Suillus subaureus]